MLNKFIITITVLTGFATAEDGATAGQSGAVPAPTKPNVLMIVVDDLKPTLGCYGDQHAKTPHMDKLAAQGTIFTHAYANQAVCGPSRCSTFTGLRPDRTKVHDLKTDFLSETPWVQSLPEIFRNQGYFTAGCGKLFHGGKSDHIMEARAYIQLTHDPDLPYNKNHPKPAKFYQNAKSQAVMQALPAKFHNRYGKVIKALKTAGANPSTEALDLPDDAYTDGALAKQGIAYLDHAKKLNKPFFIAVGFKKPHLPFTPPKTYWDMYDREKLPVATYTQAPKNAPGFAMQSWGELRNYSDIPKEGPLPSAKAKEMVHGYYASTSYVDAQIGKLLDALRERDMDKNTLVVLWSDHGWHLGDHGLWCKHSNYEQATHSVMMFAGPGVQAGKKSTALTELIDVYATTADLAGVKTPDNLDTKSLKPVLSGKTDTHRPYAQSQYPRWNGTMGYAFRNHQYRYIVWVENANPKQAPTSMPTIKAEELYLYTSDPNETNNLATDPEHAKARSNFKNYAAQFIKEQTTRIAKEPKK